MSASPNGRTRQLRYQPARFHVVTSHPERSAIRLLTPAPTPWCEVSWSGRRRG
jgi:hypothetical protein